MKYEQKILVVEDHDGPLVDAMEICSSYVPRASVIGVCITHQQDDVTKPRAYKLSEDTNNEGKWISEELYLYSWNIQDISCLLGSIYDRYACNIAIVDLQIEKASDADGYEYQKLTKHSEGGENCTDITSIPLDTHNLSPKQAGADITRHIYRSHGARYIIWRTDYQTNVSNNPRGQVSSSITYSPSRTSRRTMGQTGSPLPVRVTTLECPRIILVNKEDEKLKHALEAIFADIGVRLPKAEVEWKVSPYQLRQIREPLLTGGSVRHALKHADAAQLGEVVRTEILPHFDPPTPLGFWHRAKNAGYGDLFDAIRNSDPESNEREAACDALEKWLDRNLWGMSVGEIGALVERATQRVSAEQKAWIDSGGLAPLAGSDRIVLPCARAALLLIVENLLKNACEKRSPDTRVSVWATISGDQLILGVANRVEDAQGAYEQAARDERPLNGLRRVHEAIDGLNILSMSSLKTIQTKIREAGNTAAAAIQALEPWGFQFGFWEDGKMKELCRPPWHIGSVPDDIRDGMSPALGWAGKDEGGWATAILIAPLQTSAGDGKSAKECL